MLDIGGGIVVKGWGNRGLGMAWNWQEETNPYLSFMLKRLSFTLIALLALIGLTYGYNPPRINAPKGGPFDIYFDTMRVDGLPFQGVFCLNEPKNGAECFGIGKRESSKAQLFGKEIYELASMGKMFTAAAIMRLEEQGKLKTTQAVTDFIPNFPYSEVRLSHLLSMRSGIKDYLDLDGLWDTYDTFGTDEVIAYLGEGDVKLKEKPGKSFSYSNTNYVVLAKVVEIASGQGFGTYLRESIFIPSGMQNSFSGPNAGESVLQSPYRKKPTVAINGKSVLVEELEEYAYTLQCLEVEGDGYILTTSDDIKHWFSSPIWKRLLAKALSCNCGEYAWGLRIEEDHVWHSGWWPGIQTGFVYYPADGAYFFFLGNRDMGERDVLEELVEVAEGW